MKTVPSLVKTAVFRTIAVSVFLLPLAFLRPTPAATQAQEVTLLGDGDLAKGDANRGCRIRESGDIQKLSADLDTKMTIEGDIGVIRPQA